MTASRAGRVAAALFIVTAVLFVIGVTTEPGHDESTEATVAHDEASENTEAGTGEAAHRDASEAETVLGIDVEAPGAIALAVIVSVALAGSLWRRPLRPVGIAAVVFALLFAVLDVAEVLHQLDEDRTRYAVLAAVITAGHIAAAGASAVVARAPDARSNV